MQIHFLHVIIIQGSKYTSRAADQCLSRGHQTYKHLFSLSHFLAGLLTNLAKTYPSNRQQLDGSSSHARLLSGTWTCLLPRNGLRLDMMFLLMCFRVYVVVIKHEVCIRVLCKALATEVKVCILRHLLTMKIANHHGGTNACSHMMSLMGLLPCLWRQCTGFEPYLTLLSLLDIPVMLKNSSGKARTVSLASKL